MDGTTEEPPGPAPGGSSFPRPPFSASRGLSRGMALGGDRSHAGDPGTEQHAATLVPALSRAYRPPIVATAGSAEGAEMQFINSNGMAFIGPGSEWFWTMLQFTALTVTSVAIFRQLRAQHVQMRENSIRFANQSTPALLKPGGWQAASLRIGSLSMRQDHNRRRH